MRPPGIDVVVPSYRRPQSLGECLTGLARQTRQPERVVVVARPDDRPTWEVARAVAAAHPATLPLELVEVHEAGLVAALRAGTAATGATRVAFTDDDAVPHPGWLAGLAALLDEPGVGGAGGRDLIPGELGPVRRTVGVLSPWGRYAGAHHLGQGPPRDVHVVKGVNMAYRAEALAIPRAGALAGGHTEMHSEILICAWARRRGWRIRYDPAVTLDHRVRVEATTAPSVDHRTDADRQRANARNRMVGTLATDRDRAPVHIAYGVLVGDRECPGLTRGFVGALRGDRTVVQRVVPSIAGRARGARAALTHDVDDLMISCAELRAQREPVRA
ncbi:MAG: glycosyltransferase [Acidimicrobiia bacterium]